MAERLPSVTRSEIIIESSYQREDVPRPGSGAPPGRSAQGSRYRRSIGGPALPHRRTATGNKLRRLMFRKSKAISAGAARLTGEEGTPAHGERGGLKRPRSGRKSFTKKSSRHLRRPRESLPSLSALPLSLASPPSAAYSDSVRLCSSLFLVPPAPPSVLGFTVRAQDWSRSRGRHGVHAA